MFEFYEKATVGNVVLHKDTALPISSLRSSLVQEVVRRLLNCREKLDVERKHEILSVFAQKMMNSGHSERSIKLTIVHGITKYLFKLEASKLNEKDQDFKPLYFNKYYREEERQVTKQMAKVNWYKKKNKDEKSLRGSKCGWKQRLPRQWKGSSRAQAPVRGMEYSSLMQVPSTEGGLLLQKLVTEEDRLAKLTGYNVKIVERSGVQLVRMFQRVFSPAVCHWKECPVCSTGDGKQNTRCRTHNIVYEAICCECERQVEEGILKKEDAGVYIGESGRTLLERAKEHVKAAKDLEENSFIVKHWLLRHQELKKPPQVRFVVKKPHSDALSRLVCESVCIEEYANMNSKAEWRSNRVNRLTVEIPEWLERKKRERQRRTRISLLKN